MFLTRPSSRVTVTHRRIHEKKTPLMKDAPDCPKLPFSANDRQAGFLWGAVAGTIAGNAFLTKVASTTYPLRSLNPEWGGKPPIGYPVDRLTLCIPTLASIRAHSFPEVTHLSRRSPLADGTLNLRLP